jgi:hypothetical protein
MLGTLAVNRAVRYRQPRRGRDACPGRVKQQRATPGREPRRTGPPRAAAQACCEQAVQGRCEQPRCEQLCRALRATPGRHAGAEAPCVRSRGPHRAASSERAAGAKKPRALGAEPGTPRRALPRAGHVSSRGRATRAGRAGRGYAPRRGRAPESRAGMRERGGTRASRGPAPSRPRGAAVGGPRQQGAARRTGRGSTEPR